MFLKVCSCNLYLLLSYMLLIHCLTPRTFLCNLLALEGPLRCCILYFVRSSCKIFDYASEKFNSFIRLQNNKVPEDIRPFFFGAKLIALVKIDGGLRSISIGNTLRRSNAKCAGSIVSDKRKK